MYHLFGVKSQRQIETLIFLDFLSSLILNINQNTFALSFFYTIAPLFFCDSIKIKEGDMTYVITAIQHTTLMKAGKARVDNVSGSIH